MNEQDLNVKPFVFFSFYFMCILNVYNHPVALVILSYGFIWIFVDYINILRHHHTDAIYAYVCNVQCNGNIITN